MQCHSRESGNLCSDYWIPAYAGMTDEQLISAQCLSHGGHQVPEKDVRRRFKQGLLNFFNLYEPLLDYWTILDNSLFPPEVIASNIQGELTIYKQSLYNRIKKEVSKNDP